MTRMWAPRGQKKGGAESEGFVVKQGGRLATACPRVRVSACARLWGWVVMCEFRWDLRMGGRV